MGVRAMERMRVCNQHSVDIVNVSECSDACLVQDEQYQ